MKVRNVQMPEMKSILDHALIRCPPKTESGIIKSLPAPNMRDGIRDHTCFPTTCNTLKAKLDIFSNGQIDVVPYAVFAQQCHFENDIAALVQQSAPGRLATVRVDIDAIPGSQALLLASLVEPANPVFGCRRRSSSSIHANQSI